MTRTVCAILCGVLIGCAIEREAPSDEHVAYYGDMPEGATALSPDDVVLLDKVRGAWSLMGHAQGEYCDEMARDVGLLRVSRSEFDQILPGFFKKFGKNKSAAFIKSADTGVVFIWMAAEMDPATYVPTMLHELVHMMQFCGQYTGEQSSHPEQLFDVTGPSVLNCAFYPSEETCGVDVSRETVDNQ